MGFLVKAVKSVFKAVGSVISTVLSPIVGLFKPKTAKTSSNLRLSKTLEPEAYLKIVFGDTASGLDQRFWQVWGSKSTNFDEVIACAGHRINAFKELYFEDELAINAAGVIQPKYVGVVTRSTRLGAYGQTAMTIGDGTQWNANCNFEGVAHIGLRWTPTEKNLPNGVPTKYTQRIEGAPVYDPRKDSTIGGSGSHRYNDRTTWEYAPTDRYGVPIGRNNALQVLWYLLGWYVPNTATGELILRCGRGVNPSDINFNTFITAANDCEAAGYYTDMILSTEDSHTSNEDKMTSGGLIGQLIDAGGLWSYYANVDDTANVSLYITDDDFVDTQAVEWEEYKSIKDQYQMVSGKFIDPSPNALYQLNGYPMVVDANYVALTGLKQRKTQDYEVVQDVMLAQKLARLLLNLGQYQGELAGAFFYRALKAQAWSIVSYTSSRFGWTKLFRITRYDITQDKGVQMLLREIHPSIWTAGSVTQPIAPSAGNKYDPRQEIVATGIGWQHTTVVSNSGFSQDGVILFWDIPPANVRYTEVRLRKIGDTFWQGYSPSKGDAFVTIVPIVSGTNYEFQVRHISIHEVPGPWTPDPAQAFVAGTDGTIPWVAVSDPNGTKPDDNATNSADPASPFGPSLTVGEAIEQLEQGQVDLAAASARIDAVRADADALADQARATIYNALQQLLITDANRLRAEASVLMAGQKVSLVLKQEITSRIDGDTAIQEKISLLGVVSEDGASFILDLDKVMISPTQSFAGRLTQITSELQTNIDAKASITQLNQAISTEHDATALALQQVAAEFDAALNTKADVTAVQEAFASEQEARASDIRAVNAELGNKANTLDVNQAIADASQAQASSLEQVRAALQGGLDNKASVTDLDEAIATEQQSRASSLSDLSSQFDSKLGAKANVTDLQEAITEEQQARASDIETVNASIGEVSGEVDELKSVVVNANGDVVSKVVFNLNSAGKVVGYTATNDGHSGDIVFSFDHTTFLKPDGTPLLVLGGDGHSVYAPDLYVDKLAAGAIDFEFEGDNQLLNPTSGYQTLPGGFIIQWGQVRQRLTGGFVRVNFPLVFPTGLMAATATPFVNNRGASNQDMWVQINGNRDASYFEVTPHAGPDGQTLDGFDWMAFGR